MRRIPFPNPPVSLLWCQRNHSAVQQICASLLGLHCASLIRNADSCSSVPPPPLHEYADTHFVPARACGGQRFDSRVGHDDGLLSGSFSVRANRSGPSSVRPPPSGGLVFWPQQSNRLCGCSVSSERACPAMPGGPAGAWTRSGAAEVLSVSATGASCRPAARFAVNQQRL